MMNKKEKAKYENMRCFLIAFIILFFICAAHNTFIEMRSAMMYAKGYYTGVDSDKEMCNLLEAEMDGDYCIRKAEDIETNTTHYYSHYFNCSWIKLRIDTQSNYIGLRGHLITPIFECNYVAMKQVNE